MLSYVEDWGVTEDDIDDELVEAQEKMQNLGKKRKPSKALQLKIQHFKRLVQLRNWLKVAKHASKTDVRVQELQSQFDQLLLPYTKDWGVRQDDIDDELAESQGKMKKLKKKDGTARHCNSKSNISKDWLSFAICLKLQSMRLKQMRRCRSSSPSSTNCCSRTPRTGASQKIISTTSLLKRTKR